MKIIFATHEGTPLYGGGPYVKMLQTKQHLEQLGVEVEFLNLWKTDRKKILDADLVHLFGANFAVYNLARILTYLGKPFVVNPIIYSRRSAGFIRGVLTMDTLMRKFLRGFWWDYRFTRDICRWAERVLPNTEAEGNLLREGMGIDTDKIRVIPNGVSPEFYRADPALFRQKYGRDNFILYVGHIGPERKNVLRLVQALEQIERPAVLIAPLLETGETPAVREALHRNPRITLIEGLANDDPLLASAYAACEVFTLPSQFETPGRAAMEAALAGAKIVITPHGGTREYFRDWAIYPDPYSVESIRRAILTALEQPPQPELREHIKANYPWDVIARKTLEIYRDCLGENS